MPTVPGHSTNDVPDGGVSQHIVGGHHGSESQGPKAADAGGSETGGGSQAADAQTAETTASDSKSAKKFNLPYLYLIITFLN